MRLAIGNDHHDWIKHEIMSLLKKKDIPLQIMEPSPPKVVTIQILQPKFVNLYKIKMRFGYLNWEQVLG